MFFRPLDKTGREWDENTPYQQTEKPWRQKTRDERVDSVCILGASAFMCLMFVLMFALSFRG